MRKGFFFLLSGLFSVCLTQAQDTLPSFTLKNLGKNRIVIGWVNNFPDVRQISIQRSFDSIRGYKTILTVPDPMSVQNGYADMKAVNDHMFYRIYIQLDKGQYLFTTAKRPVWDTARLAEIPAIPPGNLPTGITIPQTDKVISDSLLHVYDSLQRARPYVVKLNGVPVNDTAYTPSPVTLKNNTNSFVPSLYVYTNRDGYIRVTLPDNEKLKKYTIKFFDNDNNFLFELKDLRESDFRLDKSNFYHAGWFRFELYEDGKLLEKHRFYLDREF